MSGDGALLHGKVVEHGLCSDYDIFLFKQGTHTRLYEWMGAHLGTFDGDYGADFAVWAPNAANVAVIGDFNSWDGEQHPLESRPDGSGIWQGFVPGVEPGMRYKYGIMPKMGGQTLEKGDPFAFFWEVPPRTASVIWDLGFEWHDQAWMDRRGSVIGRETPVSIYEVHLGSWRRVPEEGCRPLTYRECAPLLADYVTELGFTHVQLLPIMEHPFYGSWGYQVEGYFAPTARYGTPQDFMAFVDHLHQAGIGVILDWVPSHFPSDAYGLAAFDGTRLYEHDDPVKGIHPEWNSLIFNLARYEVSSFLLSSALFWLDRYHADGLRVDAVASMLYLDYARKPGEWVPNVHGGRENLDAIAFLRRLNEEIYRRFPDVQVIAEESTAYPMVTLPTYAGGLGFGFKWNMGWMHDTLAYFHDDPLFRRYHHDWLTFSLLYAFSENYVLPLSHDEVVHGKGSLLGRMPGDDWQRFANLRLLLGYLATHPGKKLLFMGGEFGQWHEWHHDESLDWHLLQFAPHQGVACWVADLNRFYRSEPAMFELDTDARGFEWIDCGDWEQSVVSFIRRGRSTATTVLVVCNCTPVVRTSYHIGVPHPGFWREVLNSDAEVYGGSGQGNLGGTDTDPLPLHGRDHSISITLPPLAISVFTHEGRA